MSESMKIPEADFYHGPDDEHFNCETVGEYLMELFNGENPSSTVTVYCSRRKVDVVTHFDCTDVVEEIENEWCGADGGGDPEGVSFPELKKILEKAITRYLKKQDVYRCELAGSVTFTAEQCRKIIGGP